MSSGAESDGLLDWIARRVRERRRLGSDPVTTAEAAERLIPSPRLAPVERLEIYREQFWLRHTGALSTDFPALRALLGRAAWESLSEEYLLRHPPRTPSLRDLGLHLPAHVASAADLPEGPVAAALATLEWAIVEAFDAADAPALDAAHLAAIPAEDWPGLRVRIAPAVRLLVLERPVAALREALLAGA
ncbi:MAG: putative DNA-binding domain-containing protein, partial [Deltaproteobacteria bacterium]|nr:putative DNA-binding domain-containing protein [Deltaproteobacteria bacterium]